MPAVHSGQFLSHRSSSHPNPFYSVKTLISAQNRSLYNPSKLLNATWKSPPLAYLGCLVYYLLLTSPGPDKTSGA